MLSSADVNGMIVIAIKNPYEETTQVLSLTYGYDIYEFEAGFDAQSQLKSVKSNTWDLKNQAVRVVERDSFLA